MAKSEARDPAAVRSDMNVPDFHDVDAYRRIQKDMSQGQIRWEFLRRSHAYRSAWDTFQKQMQEGSQSVADIKVRLKRQFSVQHLFSPRLSADRKFATKLYGEDAYVWHGLEEGSGLYPTQFDHLFISAEVLSAGFATAEWLRGHDGWVIIALDPTLKTTKIPRIIAKVLDDHWSTAPRPRIHQTANDKNAAYAADQLRVIDGVLQGYSHLYIARSMYEGGSTKSFMDGDYPLSARVNSSIRDALDAMAYYSQTKVRKPASGKWEPRYQELRHAPSAEL